MNGLHANPVGSHDVTVPVLRDLVSPVRLICMLRSQLESMKLDRIRRNDRAMSIRKLEAYLATLPVGAANLDEALLNALEDWLVGNDEPSRICHRKFSSNVRSLVNALPDELRSRRLLTNTHVRRLHRFSDFCADTKELLERFLADGRKVKRTQEGLASTSVLLSPTVRDHAVYAVTMILRHVGVDDMRRFAKEHVESYLATAGRAAETMRSTRSGACGACVAGSWQQVPSRRTRWRVLPVTGPAPTRTSCRRTR
jgi:hypothetical protein